MRTFFWIIVVVVILTIIFLWIRLIVSRISYQFGLNNVSLRNLKLSDFQTDNAHIAVSVDTRILNQNNFGIEVKNVQVWLYWNGQLVARNQDNIAVKDIRLTGNGTAQVIIPMDVYVNPNSIKLFGMIALKQSVGINYMVKFKVFGIPYTYNAVYEYKPVQQVQQ